MADKLCGMYHPWRRFRELADWLLAWADLPGELAGLTDHESRIIILDRSLTQVERRCTIAHEYSHAVRGPMPADPVLAAREEESIHRSVARQMIPLERLAEALAWSMDPAEVAADLWVDQQTLEARVRGLHPAERAYLTLRTEHHAHL